jgi:hypothetical protein
MGMDNVCREIMTYADGRTAVHRYRNFTPEMRPRDPSRDGSGLSYETLEHRGIPNMMPLAIEVRDQHGRRCLYVPPNDLEDNQCPDDPEMNGSTLRFQTLDHGGEYDDDMPQAVRVTDEQGRSCVYGAVRVAGRVVESLGYSWRVPPGWKESRRDDSTFETVNCPEGAGAS